MHNGVTSFVLHKLLSRGRPSGLVHRVSPISLVNRALGRLEVGRRAALMSTRGIYVVNDNLVGLRLGMLLAVRLLSCASSRLFLARLSRTLPLCKLLAKLSIEHYLLLTSLAEPTTLILGK